MKPIALLALAAATLFVPCFPIGAADARQSTAAVSVRVVESRGGRPLPCRITVLDSKGALANITTQKSSSVACRPGVVYTANGEAAFSVPPGSYTIYATRGMEYGISSAAVEASSHAIKVSLKLEREVNTEGYVCADTHIHTLTYSGHGDATIEERLVTLAGEGIELPVSTDHHHHTDYRPLMEKTRTTGWFTPVIGDEVTTNVGHFNAFPILPESPVPNYRLTDWKPLLADIRATRNVQVVILNHPENIHVGYQPAAPLRFNRYSGESYEGREFEVDAIEAVNSSALQSDLMRPFQDWFALLNSGRRITGVGASDSHEVNAYIVGQGRTYIASRSTDAGNINVDEACANLKSGRASISLGLFTEAWIGKQGPGEIVTGMKTGIPIRVRVQGPRWIRADRLELFANGRRVLSRPISHSDSDVVKLDSVLHLPVQAHDAWIVALTTGPGVEKPYWPIARPYQPTDPYWEPRVIGATNPIWMDLDNDGVYTSPAAYAAKLVDSARGEFKQILENLRDYDESVAVQAAALLRRQGVDLNARRAEIDRADPRIRTAMLAYLSSIPKP